MSKNTTMSITRRTALLSVAAALVTMGLKFSAFLLTGSVGLLSDAAEFSVNLVAALIAFTALTIADRPPDDDHTYGHDKAEYFSSGAEGTLILIVAAVIIYTAVKRILNPVPLENLGVGLIIALVASAINFGVSRVMLRVARQEDSIALEADANHLMTDVWTSVGVVVGVGLVALTGWQILDPLIAIAVAIQIIVMGIRLIKRSMLGLMDTTLPHDEVIVITQAIAHACGEQTPYHALRTRKSGSRRFVDFHLLLPGQTSVQESHRPCHEDRGRDRTEAGPHLCNDPRRTQGGPRLMGWPDRRRPVEFLGGDQSRTSTVRLPTCSSRSFCGSTSAFS